MKKPLKIVITAVGTTNALSVIKSLRRSKYSNSRLIGIDIHNDADLAAKAFFDKIYRICPVADKKYISQLRAICRKEKADIVIPILDAEVEKLVENKDSFAKMGVIVAADNLAAIKICNDKYQTRAHLSGYGRRVNFYSQSDVRKTVPKFPVFIKPRFGVSSRDCYLAANRAELEFFLKKVKHPVIEEFLIGDKYVIDIVNDLQGRNLVSIPRREFEAKAGVGVRSEVVKDESLIRFGQDVSQALKIIGPCNVEVFKKGKNIFLIEVNSRFSAGMILSTESGVNLPAIVLDLFLGKPIAVARLRWRAGVKMVRFWQEVYLESGKVI